jgi:hypothetical protein
MAFSNSLRRCERQNVPFLCRLLHYGSANTYQARFAAFDFPKNLNSEANTRFSDEQSICVESSEMLVYLWFHLIERGYVPKDGWII